MVVSVVYSKPIEDAVCKHQSSFGVTKSAAFSNPATPKLPALRVPLQLPCFTLIRLSAYVHRKPNGPPLIATIVAFKFNLLTGRTAASEESRREKLFGENGSGISMYVQPLSAFSSLFGITAIFVHTLATLLVSRDLLCSGTSR